MSALRALQDYFIESKQEDSDSYAPCSQRDALEASLQPYADGIKKFIETLQDYIKTSSQLMAAAKAKRAMNMDKSESIYASAKQYLTSTLFSTMAGEGLGLNIPLSHEKCVIAQALISECQELWSLALAEKTAKPAGVAWGLTILLLSAQEKNREAVERFELTHSRAPLGQLGEIIDEMLEWVGYLHGEQVEEARACFQKPG